MLDTTRTITHMGFSFSLSITGIGTGLVSYVDAAAPAVEDYMHAQGWVVNFYAEKYYTDLGAYVAPCAVDQERDTVKIYCAVPAHDVGSPHYEEV